MGYANAIGFDLNPGPANPFVSQGDFNNLPLTDSSVDAVYSNCVDHAFDLGKMFGEARRVLRPGGLFLYDLTCSKAGMFEAVDVKPEIVLQQHCRSVAS